MYNCSSKRSVVLCLCNNAKMSNLIVKIRSPGSKIVAWINIVLKLTCLEVILLLNILLYIFLLNKINSFVPTKYWVSLFPVYSTWAGDDNTLVIGSFEEEEERRHDRGLELLIKLNDHNHSSSHAKSKWLTSQLVQRKFQQRNNYRHSFISQKREI